MKNWLTNATKNRVIRELRQILLGHPRYRGDFRNVQNKFGFDQRPQRGIIVQGTSADRVKLSADNYIGRLSSFVMHARVGNKAGNSIEWVKENQGLLEEFSPKRDVFPSPPGVYLMEVVKDPDEALNRPGEFVVDPVLSVPDEPLIVFGSDADAEAQLIHQDVYPGSVRLWLDGRRPLLLGVDYEVDYDTGLVSFLRATPPGATVFADYRYKLDRQGPFPFYYEHTDTDSIPGAVLAFGERAECGDKWAVVVNSTRTDSADVYGGKFEVFFDLTVFSRDAEDREKFSDFVVIQLLERQNTLGFDGLELMDVSPGGESEEIYNAEQEDYYYDSSISVGFRVDWEVYVPLPIEVFRIEQTSKASEQETGYMDGTHVLDLLNATGDPADVAGVALMLGKDVQFERIR